MKKKNLIQRAIILMVLAILCSGVLLYQAKDSGFYSKLIAYVLVGLFWLVLIIEFLGRDALPDSIFGRFISNWDNLSKKIGINQFTVQIVGFIILILAFLCAAAYLYYKLHYS